MSKVDSSNVATRKYPDCCCPKFDLDAFEKKEKEMTFDGKHFVQDIVYSFFYWPLTFERMTNRVCTQLDAADATPDPKDCMMIQRVDPCSPWWADMFITSTKEVVPGAKMATISGNFLTKVFEGPYSNMGKWVKNMHEYVKKEKGKDTAKIYAWYTTCPKCAKEQGKNYVVLYAQID